MLGGPNANGQSRADRAAELANNLEWDNLPAQRCYWYQVQKAGTPARVDLNFGDPVRIARWSSSSTRTCSRGRSLNTGGQPYILNAALIAPNVINVIPQTIFIR